MQTTPSQDGQMIPGGFHHQLRHNFDIFLSAVPPIVHSLVVVGVRLANIAKPCPPVSLLLRIWPVIWKVNTFMARLDLLALAKALRREQQIPILILILDLLVTQNPTCQTTQLPAMSLLVTAVHDCEESCRLQLFSLSVPECISKVPNGSALVVVAVKADHSTRMLFKQIWSPTVTG
jgi:hypothetical protein